jgi:hypothetical protein
MRLGLKIPRITKFKKHWKNSKPSRIPMKNKNNFGEGSLVNSLKSTRWEDPLKTRSASHRQENQSQRRSTFERLGPSGSHNKENRRGHSQSNRVEQPRESRSRVPIQTAPWNYSCQNDSWLEGGAELEYREAGAHDRFPCFAN